MLRLTFIDDDPEELTGFLEIVQGKYDCTTVQWPDESANLFSSLAPSIFVSDLYLPPRSGGRTPTPTERQAAASACANVVQKFDSLYKGAARDDKRRLRDTMEAILDAYGMLGKQVAALGQSPDYGVSLLQELQSCYPGVPVVFYSRKITPEDVIRVLRAGAADAIRKGAVKPVEVLNRLEEIIRGSRPRYETTSGP